MILRKVRLKNIRSYKEATIELSEGTTLLAGDIGAGKSTILLAAEFALFGVLRDARRRNAASQRRARRKCHARDGNRQETPLDPQDTEADKARGPTRGRKPKDRWG